MIFLGGVAAAPSQPPIARQQVRAARIFGGVGRRLSVPLPALDARRVADAIVHAARSPRPTTMVGSVTTVMRLAHLLAPNLAARLLKSAMATYLMRASPAKAKSDGNLHFPSTDAAHREGGQVAPSSIGSARFGTCCSVRNSACCEGKIIARPRPGGCRPDAGVRCNRRLDLSRCARRFSRCTSCALHERSLRAFLHEPPVKSAVPELHLARKPAVLEKRAFH